MKKTSILFYLLISLNFYIAAETSLENSNTTFLLPIDWSKEPQLNLSVNIPKGFKPIQPESIWDKIELIEFIPEKENESHWSEIITIQKIINKGISADQITSLLIENFSKKIPNFTVLSHENSNENYQVNTFIAKYHYDRKNEIIGAKYLSGPYDLIGVQYTIRPNKKQSQQEIIQKIKSFFDGNLSITKNYKKNSI